MKRGPVILAVLGLALGALLVYWWMELRVLPTLRFSHTIGKGNAIDLDWIELR